MTVQGGHHVPVAGRAFRHTIPLVCSRFGRLQIFKSRVTIWICDGLAACKAREDKNIGPSRAIGTATLVAGDEVQCFQMS
ncbi:MULTISPECIES: hypothetical protein [unclassified Pseudovibrio]|uniref:hypothetical protein n=1 Tax=unclassified Pseudovibrio TaxID=2627060 RepID=UPI0007AEC21D|nr:MULTISPECIES: hypothetical protein [unclassified Pseudovibrio]